MILRELSFRGTPLAVVEQHHHVLIPWTRLARRTGRQYHAVTLDHHTDVLPAFHRCSSRGNYDFSTEEAVLSNLALLRHDEHLDWALRAGVLSSVRILSHEDFTECAHPAMTVSRDRIWPDVQEILDGTERARNAAEQVLETEYLERQIPEVPSPLILDLDLDNFLCGQALHPRDPSYFLRLAEAAELITVSLERDWVRCLRFRGETITADTLLNDLLKLA